jgi:putative redox protein
MQLEAHVSYPAPGRIRAQARDLVVEVGPPPHRGGDPDTYGPFDILLAALATCTGFPVMDFLEERGFPAREAAVHIRAQRGEDSHLLEEVEIEILAPPGFPKKYEAALLRAAGLCFIKEQLGKAPLFTTKVRTASEVGETS